jgi:hypothetical protein
MITPHRQPESPWQFLRRSKREAAIGLTAGITIAAGAKYICAAFLILWLAAGGQ